MTPPSAGQTILICHDLIMEARPKVVDRAFETCIRNCQRIVSHARVRNWLVLHSYRSGDIHPLTGLSPLPSEAVLTRPGPSAFSNRALRRALFARSVDELVVIGCGFTSTCLPTVFASLDRAIPTTLIVDATIDATPGHHPLDIVSFLYGFSGLQIRRTTDLLAGALGLSLVAGGTTR